MKNVRVISISMTPELWQTLRNLALVDDSKVSPYICRVLEAHVRAKELEEDLQMRGSNVRDTD